MKYLKVYGVKVPFTVAGTVSKRYGYGRRYGVRKPKAYYYGKRFYVLRRGYIALGKGKITRAKGTYTATRFIAGTVSNAVAGTVAANYPLVYRALYLLALDNGSYLNPSYRVKASTVKAANAYLTSVPPNAVVLLALNGNFFIPPTASANVKAANALFNRVFNYGFS